jgi:xanthine dehydrogenase YagT iron-sulfur-binding subunit
VKQGRQALVGAYDEKPITLWVNGQARTLAVEPRVTLVDALRDRLGLSGTKKGCDRGECGACTVHVNGRRVLACLTLTVMVEGSEVTTIEGIADGAQLHPVQEAFLACDAFQCGFCTPGQVMSALACIAEGHTGSAAEIKEWMSGNLCRCAAYPQIVEAIQTVAAQTVATPNGGDPAAGDPVRSFAYAKPRRRLLRAGRTARAWHSGHRGRNRAGELAEGRYRRTGEGGGHHRAGLGWHRRHQQSSDWCAGPDE